MGAMENAAALEPFEDADLGPEEESAGLKMRRRKSGAAAAAEEALDDDAFAAAEVEENDAADDGADSEEEWSKAASRKSSSASEGMRRRSSARKSASKRQSKSKRKSKSVEVATTVADPEAVASAAVYLRSVAAVVLTVLLVLDILGLGFRGNSTAFIDWWDMIGTVSYVRGRNPIYSIRKRENQTSIGWALYTLFNAYFLYVVAGKTARTIMRKTLVLPSFSGFIQFTLMGFLPLHFFPGDHLFEMVEHNDIQQVIVAMYWATTKTRSVFNQVDEALNQHHYNFFQAFLLGVLSCEIASFVGRIDRNVNVYPLEECIRRVPGGLKAWLTSRTFMSSVFVSIFCFTTVRTLAIPGVWTIFIGLTFCAAFYRYANGLFERTLGTYVLGPARESDVFAAIMESRQKDSGDEDDEDEDEEDELDDDAPILDKLAHFQKTKVKNAKRALESFEALVLSAAQIVSENLEEKLPEVPVWLTSQAERGLDASRLVLGQLKLDTYADAQSLQDRVEEIQDELEHSAKKLKLL
ncbi:Hypothetical Protein FCC1311_092992 [Hondaea fermentalgiana]|uniref:Uncharacterized protein n=1 Tax=Hondaea fermentalgiana TaxID=2315210 RepID=A0A2R5GR56_9STRA|nr:Hypothetical Protein FCC1311_092992 [Hondaea fermentalgiana]|eukprot:GBG33075.1 Hypothetical Protein FCC1311_092992 [Hondaea fermentalgiana]